MKSVWKFPLRVTDFQGVAMPTGAKVLTVQVQDGGPCLWALVDTRADLVTRHFATYGTGHDAHGAGEYAGSYQLNGGQLVFHVFEYDSAPAGRGWAMLEGIERGFICDDPTGRAGEDSIYVGVSGIGPWCESCHADMVQEVEGDTRAEERALWAAKVAEIRAAVEAEREAWDAATDIGASSADARYLDQARRRPGRPAGGDPVTPRELQPCPFCGGSAEIVGEFELDVVACQTCYARTDAFVGDGEYAITAWNRRVPDAAERALARFGAMVLDWSPLECGFPTMPGAVIDELAVRAGVAHEDSGDGGHACWTAPGVKLAVARLLAPDGAVSDG